MLVRSIIVDDIELNREILSDLIKEHFKNIQIIGSASDGSQAIKLINSTNPDLVFLDVEMPDMNGFDVLAKLDNISFKTIFVTSHSHYAIQAIRFNALDYILKPIKLEELSNAINRFTSLKSTNNKLVIQNALENYSKNNISEQVLFLPTQEGGIKMILKDIIFIESDRNYSVFHLKSSQSKISSKTLGYFEEILADKGFFRCHRSYILNQDHVTKKTLNSFVMSNGQVIAISRRKLKEAKDWYRQI